MRSSKSKNIAKMGGGPSCPTHLPTPIRPGSRQSPAGTLPTAGSNNASIPGRVIPLLAVLALSSLMLACGNKSLPDGVLDKSQMASVLTDFYIKEARVNGFKVNEDSSLVLFEYYRHQYMDSLHLGDSVLEKSYRYYLAHPAELSEIYDRVIDTLALREQRADVAAPVKKVE